MVPSVGKFVGTASVTGKRMIVGHRWNNNDGGKSK